MKNEEIQYCFTKYVKTAVQRARKDYRKKEQKYTHMEELQKPEDMTGYVAKEITAYEIWEAVPYPDRRKSAESIRKDLEELLEDRMRKTIRSLTELEVRIVYEKVFQEKTFAEIGEQLQMDWKKVASVYSYARKKMRKGWEKNEI